MANESISSVWIEPTLRASAAIAWFLLFALTDKAAHNSAIVSVPGKK